MATDAPIVEYYPTIKELPEGERPRERLEHYGAPALSSAELLAIILRVGTKDENVIRLAQRLLTTYNGLAGLAQAPFSELVTIKGLGQAKTTQLKAAFELGRRLLVAAPHERPMVKSPADAANLLMLEMGLLEQEHLRAVILDSKNHVLKVHTIYIGSLNTAVVRVGELFREAIRINAAAVIVAHNHPSGDPTPSAEDVHVTRQIVEAGKLLGIDVLDHLVICQARWVSLKERGLGF
ncbi:MAG: JAB domain-containing protein [Chloroflexi bacterium]|nr:JAB domain-containing protein [Chloroflexota bacterium]